MHKSVVKYIIKSMILFLKWDIVNKINSFFVSYLYYFQITYIIKEAFVKRNNYYIRLYIHKKEGSQKMMLILKIIYLF